MLHAAERSQEIAKHAKSHIHIDSGCKTPLLQQIKMNQHEAEAY